MKKLFTITLVLCLAFSGVISNTASAQTTSHWAESGVSWAKTEGLLSINGSDSRSYEATVTRAEFIKMTLTAMKLTPGSGLAAFLRKNSFQSPSLETIYKDLAGNSLTTSGYAQIAVDYGLILSTDYSAQNLFPDTPITRYDAARIITRMIGHVFPSQVYPDPRLSFTDGMTIKTEYKGMIGQLAKLAILRGYEDGEFKGDRQLTLAEACVILKRSVEYSERGLDSNVRITVYSKFLADEQDFVIGINKTSPSVELESGTPIQIIDGVVYVPARLINDAARTLYYNEPWNGGVDYWGREDQRYGFEWGNSGATYIAGWDCKDDSYQAIAPYRILRGEIMIAVTSGKIVPEENVFPLIATEWLPQMKTLNIALPWYAHIGS